MKKPLFSIFWMERPARRRKYNERTAAYCHHPGRKREMAKAKGMPRNYGHAQGSKNVERICEEAWRMGIKYLTVYAFSTENWNGRKVKSAR